ncbi:MAG: DotA/TraY family protein [Alphaproteobacteria bacterium]|nr:DotA/TraY family protein [Alphaproteobacteria bacterium]
MFGLLPKGTLNYAIMPHFMPRLRDLWTGGFHYVPYFLALVFQMVRLLPQNHPYVMPRNMGRFGVRHVLAQAALNLRFKVKNIDQLFLFGLILVGIVIFFVQFLTLGAFIFLSPAMALPTNFAGFFTIQNVNDRPHDLAFMMLDMVFGVPHPSNAAIGLFESCVSNPFYTCENTDGIGVIPFDTNNASGLPLVEKNRLSPFSVGYPFPSPIHLGLHRLFAVYSTGLLVIAVAITSYFVATVLAETAQSGTPFGRRYNKTWVPFRIVIAFGLLMPLGSGLNSSQYIVLYMAKFGSAFATNGWNYFNNSLTTSYLGQPVDMIAKPNYPDVGAFSQFMFLAKLCEYIYENKVERRQVDASNDTNSVPYVIEAYVMGASTKAPLLVTGATFYDAVIAYLDDGTNSFKVRFGERNAILYPKELGNVKPLCGELTFFLADARDPASTDPPEPGPYRIQRVYFAEMNYNWRHAGPVSSFWQNGTEAPPTATNNTGNRWIKIANDIFPPTDSMNKADLDDLYVSAVNKEIKDFITLAINNGINDQIASGSWGGAWNGAGDPLYRKGWAGAGIWYNKISEMNGLMTTAAISMPAPSLYPMVMEGVWSAKTKYVGNVTPDERFNPNTPGSESVEKYLEGIEGLQIAQALYLGYKYWGAAEGTNTASKPTGNPIEDAIIMLFGLDGLYDMRKNQNATRVTHPLAQLVGIGRGLMESAVRNLGYATIATMGGVVLGDIMGQFPKNLASSAASMFVSVAMLGVTVGFVLAYIVPFLPFIYFFFAVGGWVKGIFEAMVGAPLWALAHIRIDAHGLPGNAAISGYFLIFEIFLRPILIVFGLLASITIFSALVAVLNSIFTSVVSNVGGFDMTEEITNSSGTGINLLGQSRGRIDQFFYTVIYAIIVYLMGMSSFKLIDTVPNNILRWMGQSVATFNDSREDPAKGLVSRGAISSQQVSSRIGGALQGLTKIGG